MTLLESITLALAIIGSISGLIIFYILLNDYFGKKPKVIEAYREIGIGHDQNLFIKLICVDNTRIDKIYIKDYTKGCKYEIYPDSPKSKVLFTAGEHLITIPVKQEFIEQHIYSLIIKTNYDKIIFKNKSITRALFVKTSIKVKVSASANLSVM